MWRQPPHIPPPSRVTEIKLLSRPLFEPFSFMSSTQRPAEASLSGNVVSSFSDSRVVPSAVATAASLVQLVSAQAQIAPTALALVSGVEAVTYADLERQANQLAHYLRTLGVGPDVLVGLCVERSAAMVIAALGILKAGGAYLPLDPAYPPERLAYMLEDSRVPVLITKSAISRTLPVGGRTVLNLDQRAPEIASQ